jgi:hypothetical protein
MCHSFCRNVFISIICFSLSGIGMPRLAKAEVIETTAYLALQDRGMRIERINDALMQDKVRNQLTVLGVSPEYAQQRVAALTDAELRTLDARLEDLPAGGSGVLEVVLVVFLILLILDLTGATDVFPGIGPGKAR